MLPKRFSKYAPMLAAAVATGLGATSAMAALTIDLRVTAITGAGSTGGSFTSKSVTPGPSGNITVTMAVWAQVTGSNNNLPDDVQSATGSFLSTGLLLGNLNVSNIPTLFQGTAFSTGFATDLDGDGDNDVGSNINNDADNFFRARAGKMTGPKSNFDGSAVGLSTNTIPNGTEYRIALLRFVQFGGAGQSTDVNFRPWNVAEGAVWGEDQNEVPTIDDGGTTDDTSDDTTVGYTYADGNVANPALGTFGPGPAVHIGSGGGVVPEPMSLGLISAAGLGLLARRRK